MKDAPSLYPRGVVVLPFEFVIDGPPVSQQTRRRERLRNWICEVQNEAKRHWPNDELPISSLVMVKITYFYEDVSIDVDNISKPILDALKGLVFADDDQVTDLLCRKRNLRGIFRAGNASIVLSERLDRENEFLYIAVQDAPNQEVING